MKGISSKATMRIITSTRAILGMEIGFLIVAILCHLLESLRVSQPSTASRSPLGDAGMFDDGLVQGLVCPPPN